MSTLSQATLNALELKEAAFRLLPLTRVIQSDDGSYGLALFSEASDYLKEFKQRFGKENTILLSNYLVRLHNIAERDAEDLFAED